MTNRQLNSLKFTSFTISAIVLLAHFGSAEPVQAADAADFEGKRVVHLLQEPRHRTVHHEGNLYLLDVQINPGDMSLPHTHDQAILLTYISSADGSREGAVSSITDYASESYTHEVANEGPGLLRIMALVNAGAGQSANANDEPTGLDTDPQLENPWFRSWRFELAPGESTSVQTHQVSSIIVQVADGLVHVSRPDGITAELDHQADWEWRDANTPFQIHNAGQIATTVVVNEGR